MSWHGSYSKIKLREVNGVSLHMRSQGACIVVAQTTLPTDQQWLRKSNTKTSASQSSSQRSAKGRPGSTMVSSGLSRDAWVLSSCCSRYQSGTGRCALDANCKPYGKLLTLQYSSLGCCVQRCSASYRGVPGPWLPVLWVWSHTYLTNPHRTISIRLSMMRRRSPKMADWYSDDSHGEVYRKPESWSPGL